MLPEHLLISWGLVLWAAPLLLVGQYFLPFFRRYLPISAVALLSVSALLAAGMLWVWNDLNNPPLIRTLPWLDIRGVPALQFGFYLDQFSVLMAAVVVWITLAVLVFSLRYMRGEPLRYWGLLALFQFAMLGVVFSANLLQLFLFWELLGVSSYLLIGFWFDREGPRHAAPKAFWVNRVGDACLLAGLFLLWHQFGGLEWTVLDSSSEAADANSGRMTLISVLLLLGACGKSAQVPFQVWLPDAMAGPTPVSALMHAATMVAAGVFLLIRLLPVLTPDALHLLTGLGAVTLLLGALSATQQRDIKKLLAWSTVSQLGYMMLGVGLAAPAAAMFHLTTHAFFKAGLFLTAAQLIHTLHRLDETQGQYADAQDMFSMGGMMKWLPRNSLFFTLFAASLAGIPLTAGFLSKESLLLAAAAFADPSQQIELSSLYPLACAGFGVLLTAGYMVRAWKLIYAGPARWTAQDIQAVPPADWVLIGKSEDRAWSFGLPLLGLGLGTLWIGYALIPWATGQDVGLLAWLQTDAYTAQGESSSGTPAAWITPLSLGLVTVGGLLGWFLTPAGMQLDTLSSWRLLLRRGLGFDFVYERLMIGPLLQIARGAGWIDRYLLDGLILGIVRIVAGTGRSPLPTATAAGMARFLDAYLIEGSIGGIIILARLLGGGFRRLQTGNAQTYMLLSLLGGLAVLLLWWL